MSTLLNFQFANCYEELIRYYPRYYREVREMVAILSAHGRFCDTLQDNIEQVYANNFIDTMDENAIALMEEFLGIALDKSRTLDERRRYVKASFTGFGTISASMLEEMIHAYTGADVHITFEPADEEGNNLLTIEVERGEEETLYMSDILTLLAKKLPAHIWYKVTFLYDLPGVVIGGKSHKTIYKFLYPVCGTIPDTAMKCVLAGVDTVVERDSEEYKFSYPISEEDGLVSGRIPNIAMLGALEGTGAVIESGTADKYSFAYPISAEDGLETGQEPIVITSGKLQQVSSVTEASVQVGGIDYPLCGSGYTAQN